MFNITMSHCNQHSETFDLELFGDAEEFFEEMARLMVDESSQGNETFTVSEIECDVPCTRALIEELADYEFQIDSVDDKTNRLFEYAIRAAAEGENLSEEERLIVAAFFEDQGWNYRNDFEASIQWLGEEAYEFIANSEVHYTPEIEEIAHMRYEQGYYYQPSSQEAKRILGELEDYIDWDDFARDYELQACNVSWLTPENNDVCETNEVCIERRW